MSKEEQEQIDQLALKPKDFLVKELQIKELRARIASILKTLGGYNKKFALEYFSRLEAP